MFRIEIALFIIQFHSVTSSSRWLVNTYKITTLTMLQYIASFYCELSCQNSWAWYVGKISLELNQLRLRAVQNATALAPRTSVLIIMIFYVYIPVLHTARLSVIQIYNARVFRNTLILFFLIIILTCHLQSLQHCSDRASANKSYAKPSVW